jgi:hypothetical protein
VHSGHLLGGSELKRLNNPYNMQKSMSRNRPGMASKL